MRRCVVVLAMCVGCFSSPSRVDVGQGEAPEIDPDAPNAPCRHKASCAIVEVPEQTFEQATRSLNVDCDPTPLEKDEFGQDVYAFTFTLSSGARSFLVVPYVPRGLVRLVDIETPEGPLNVTGEYRHHNQRLGMIEAKAPTGTYAEVAMDWPVLVPYAPQYTRFVVPGGEYTAFVSTDTAAPCMYVIEQVERPRTLDINFYFVGVDGLNAQSAPTHRNFQDVLARFEGIYAQLDVGLGQVRYFDVEGDVAGRFSVVRSSDDMPELMSFGVSPGASLEENLSIDAFIVSDIATGNGIVGVSGGVPGAAGMHGNPSNGLIFSALDLGWSNQSLAHIMAHEIGHFLGLRHTTEYLKNLEEVADLQQEIDMLLGLADPLPDTPECDTPSVQMTRCPDYENLMYPVAPMPDEEVRPVLTPHQRAALTLNPLLQ